MAWCKTNVSDFSGEIFFSSKVPEFLHVLFNLVVKHSPVFLWAFCTKYEGVHNECNGEEQEKTIL